VGAPLARREDGVIARLWRGWTRAEDADEYGRYLERTGMTVARSTPGNRGAYVLCRPEGERAEFLTVLLWESQDFVRAFAGEQLTRARFFPEDDRFLVERELEVRHYEVVTGP
jgi:heme-degrading monooxygenase HmoA